MEIRIHLLADHSFNPAGPCIEGVFQQVLWGFAANLRTMGKRKWSEVGTAAKIEMEKDEKVNG